MNEPGSKQRASDAGQAVPRPGVWHLFIGVLFPAVVILTELLTQLCAETLFDPLPTPWHILAVAAVPVINLVVLGHLRYGRAVSLRWLAFGNGLAMAVAGFYTLLFLPLLPLGVIVILFYGLGLLPFGPLLSLLSSLMLRRAFLRRYAAESHRRGLRAGVAMGLVLLLVLDIPTEATRFGMQWAGSGNAVERERGLSLLRTLGDDELLLRFCYEANSRSPGLLGWLTGVARLIAPGEPRSAVSPETAREIYYRVHGVPFNAKPAPFSRRSWSRFADFEFDTDLGGAVVGGRVRGLNLISSRIDGSISGDDALAYLEWVVEFQNSSAAPREVRLQLALPPGGVVSRATLWVQGEEREAAYGSRGAVRSAYQQVAVQQRRDPLLVTTKGADRVLAQAFPVPANGGTLKFKIGITAPLGLRDASTAQLTLPAIVDRNFSFAPDMSHSLWIEAKGVLSVTAPSLQAGRVRDALYRVSGQISDQELTRARQRIVVARDPAARSRVARGNSGDSIRQDLVPAGPSPEALMLAVDGSSRLRASREELVEVLNAIPSGARVGMIIAQEPMLRLALAPWSDAQKEAAVAMLKDASFEGGQDNSPALTEALLALEPVPGGMLLWVHGPQPVNFGGSRAQLEQATSRLSSYPEIMLYGVEPGPNELLPDTPWSWGARDLPRTGAVVADLSDFLARAYDPVRPLALTRSLAVSSNGLTPGSEQIAALWARDRILALMRENSDGNRSSATALATQHHLVTPVSGAVVLETKQQFDENRLAPAEQAKVPTVPEPREWILTLIACLALLWLVWRNRTRLAFVP